MAELPVSGIPALTPFAAYKPTQTDEHMEALKRMRGIGSELLPIHEA